MKNRSTIILSGRDVKKLVDMRTGISAVERVFGEYAAGRTQMPAKIYVDLKEYEGDFRAMPAYVSRLKACTLKWVNVHARNPGRGLPTVMAVIILSDPTNGYPLSIMDGTYITGLRTGAAGAVAAKYLARKDSAVVSLVGCGVQARTQLDALKEIFRIKEVRVWGHQPVLVSSFIKDMRPARLNMVTTRNVKDCVKGGDIVVTTTPSRRPIVKLAWLKKGVHINAIGADAKGKQELDHAILRKAKIVVDDWVQASHSGEINVAIRKKIITKRNIYAALGDIVAGRKRGRVSPDEITVFDSTGLAIQDTVIAQLIYKTALKLKVGRKTVLI